MRAQQSEIVEGCRPYLLVRLGLPRDCEHLELEVPRDEFFSVFVGTWQSADDIKSVVSWLEERTDDLCPLILGYFGNACTSTVEILGLRSVF